MNRYGEFKRRCLREDVQIPTWISFHGVDDPQFTHTIDLAPEGALFSSVKPVEPLSLVLLRLELIDRDVTVECKGRVCWSQTTYHGMCHYGVRFLDLADDERDMLEMYLAGTHGAAPRTTAVFRPVTELLETAV